MSLLQRACVCLKQSGSEVNYYESQKMKACQQGFNPSYAEEAPALDDLKLLEGYAFLEFGAPWCQHCQAAADSIQHVLSTLNLPHIKVFDGKGKVLGREFKVKLWPTLILLNSGVERNRIVRPTSIVEVQQLVDEIQKLSNNKN